MPKTDCRPSEVEFGGVCIPTNIVSIYLLRGKEIRHLRGVVFRNNCGFQRTELPIAKYTLDRGKLNIWFNVDDINDIIKK